MKLHWYLVIAVSLLFSGVAKAQFFTGSFGVVVNPFASSTASYSSSTLTLNSLNVITTAESGTFLSLVPSLSDLTAYTGTLTGLTTTPVAESVSNYFVFSAPDATFASLGTTPNNRFVFDLTSLSEPTSGVFDGVGVMVDTQSVLTTTPAEFTLSFSGPSNYSFTVAAVPEPTTWGLLLGGISALVFVQFLRRRKL